MSKLDRFTNSEQLSLEDLLAKAGRQSGEHVQSKPGNDKANLVYYVFRTVSSTGQKVPKLPPEEVLAKALPAFREQFGQSPCAVVCHPTWAGAVKAALNGDGNITVIPVGGCLIPELWLALPEERGVEK
jgi:hypothetical protein